MSINNPTQKKVDVGGSGGWGHSYTNPLPSSQAKLHFPHIFDQNNQNSRFVLKTKKSFQKSLHDIILRFNSFCFHISVSYANKRQSNKALFCHFIYLKVIMSNLQWIKSQVKIWEISISEEQCFIGGPANKQSVIE